MNCPILFLIFNRPDTTQKVCDVIRQIKPKRLFIAADGPRSNKLYEKELCDQVRQIVLNNIDWECEVKTLFRDKNLGCGMAISEAIGWFFDNVEQGIILEDDCLPTKSFFQFCDVLLEKYKNEEKIMMISGYNPATSINEIESDYFYSRAYPIWGWATWKRAWRLYDIEMKKWPNERRILLKKHYSNIFTRNYLTIALNNTYSKLINTWDYQWAYSCITNNAFCIIPKFNMVSNIGATGTHTNNKISKSLFSKSFDLNQTNFTPPAKLIPNIEIDNYVFKKAGISKLSFKNILYLLLEKSKLYYILIKIKFFLKK